MIKESVVAFLVFYFLLWLVAGINTNQWMPPSFSFLPENPRVLSSYLGVFILFLITSGLMKFGEELVFNLTIRLPKVLSSFLYNLLFFIISAVIAAVVFFISYYSFILSGIYKNYLPRFYVRSEVGSNQIEIIFLLSFLALFILSLLFTRRKIFFK